MVQYLHVPALQQQVLTTELGPCMVTIQPTAGAHAQTPAIADVYLHGAAGDWSTFRPLLPEAADRDRVLIDLPGWGASTEGARLEHLSLSSMSHVVAGIVDSLGYQRWNLVGHSMGGFLALHLAAARPERVASVAAISATTFAAAEAVRTPFRSLFRFPAFVGMLILMRFLTVLGPAGLALVRGVGKTPVMGLLMRPFFADPALVSSSVIQALGDDARPAGFSAAAQAAAGYDFGRWSEIRCPVLAIRGRTDVFTPPSDLTRMASLVPQLQSVTLSRCGHFAHVEQPQRVQRLLTDLHSS